MFDNKAATIKRPNTFTHLCHLSGQTEVHYRQLLGKVSLSSLETINWLLNRTKCGQSHADFFVFHFMLFANSKVQFRLLGKRKKF